MKSSVQPAVISRYMHITLWLCATACAALSLFFAFKAGCIGDMKSGVLDGRDREIAMDYEGMGVTVELLGLLLSSIAMGSNAKLATIQRIGGAIVVPIVGLILLTVLGIQAEVWGVQSCFPRP